METNLYTFDDAGRLVAQTINPAGGGAGGLSRAYGYDFQSRMTSLTDTNGSVFTYAFDGEGNRISQSLNDCLTTRFVYDAANAVMEINASNEVVRAYINGQGMDQPIERIGFIDGTARQRQVFHADGLGSIAALSDESGEFVQSYSYAAFGRIRARTGSDLNRVTYTAREALGDSFGFYYYRNRVLDPNTGRFTSEDPLGFVDGANRSIYAVNNPVEFNDPYGLIIGALVRAYALGQVISHAAQTGIYAYNYHKCMERMIDFQKNNPCVRVDFQACNELLEEALKHGAHTIVWGAGRMALLQKGYNPFSPVPKDICQ